MSDSFKLFAEKLGGRNVTSFTARYGEMFYNPETGELRLGDGDTPGGISLFKALASDFGISADGGDTIINDFNVITYDGGNANSPYSIYDIVDGNVPNSPTITVDTTQQYDFTNTITFSNTIIVNSVNAAGSTGIDGQVLKSTGYGVAWANSNAIVANNTTLSFDGTNPSVVSDNSNATVSVASGGVFNIPNFSGMLLVNDHFDGGVALYIAGGGSGVLVSNTNSAFDTGLVGGNNSGYDWTNSTNLTGPFTFTVVKTRNAT